MEIKDGVLVEVVGDDRYKRVIKVPEGVTEIGKSAFYLVQKTKKVILPKGVETIHANAFSDTDISHVHIPEGVKEIHSHAFYSSDLRSITIPDSVTYIGDGCFDYCKNLKKVKLPKNLETMGDTVFTESAVEKVTIPEGVKELKYRTFYHCKELRKVVIPESVEKIDEASFQACYKLKSVKLPENLKEISNYLFKQCEELSYVNIPKSVKTIGREAFKYCKNLKTIELPSDLSIIFSGAFSNSGLKKIVIPEKVSDIHEKAFYGCQNLSEVVLPKNLQYLPEYMFGDCRSLKSISLPENLREIGIRTFNNTGIESIKLPSSLVSIGNFAFASSALKSIEIPEGVRQISLSAFRNCKNLTDVKLPSTLTTINSDTFSDCNNLTKIDLPESLTSIADAAFSSTGLTDIKIPDGIISLSPNLFSNCTKLKNIKLPKNLISINESAFYNCYGLTELNLPSTVQEISYEAFYQCSGLTEIKIPDNVHKIGKRAFGHCSNLKTIEIPEQITTLDDETFRDCESLESIKLPEGLTKIGELCFYKCSMLKSIELPNTVTNIGENAFKGCSSLESITIPDSVINLSGLTSLSSNMNYMTKTKKGYKISSKPEENSFNIAELGLNLKLLGDLWSEKETLFSETKNPLIKNFYNVFMSDIEVHDSRDFIQNHNFTFFKKLKNYDHGNVNYNTYKMFYNLGGLSTPVEVNGKQIDYAQKFSNFLFEKLTKKETSIVELNTIFSGMEISGFKREFTEFFMKDFDELLKQEKENPGFISKCYNSFEEIQKTNTSNRGSQRQLKPTVEKFVDYFNVSKFDNVTPETKYIADAISPYFSDQDNFDDSVWLMQEFKDKNIPTRLLKNRLYDTSSPFYSIDMIADEIRAEQAEILGNLTSVATNEFTFDWLEKNDPTNLFLGKLCSCCAHLEGAGRSIMMASIIHPNVQNLVIRNKRNEIIAKSTLYINPDEGYGVFNNVEIYDDDSSLAPSDVQVKIYEKYLEAVEKFANQYNKENPNKPLKQINVGGGNNDLINYIQNHRVSKKKFDADYSKLTRDPNDDYGYSGDSKVIQYVLWTKEQGIKTTLSAQSEKGN